MQRTDPEGPPDAEAAQTHALIQVVRPPLDGLEDLRIAS